MKQLFLTSFVLCTTIAVFSQANTQLSNLVSPTAVNQTLQPKVTNTSNLGSSSLSWKDLYLRGYVYLDGTRFLSNAPGTTSFNAFAGSYAGYSITSGKYNTALGHYALYKDTSGSYNTASGAYALYKNSTGTDNTAMGYQALDSNLTGRYNSAYGSQALLHNTKGFNNTAGGAFALTSNTTGNSNTASGAYALFYNTTGNANTGSGYHALYNNTIGIQNTATGYHALNANTTGNNNTASGTEALYINTTGTNNTATGIGALYANTEGSENTASGAYTLNYNTTGTYNTGSGNYALHNNTTGYDNTAYGANALYNTTVSNHNTAIGYSAGRNYNNGWYNVFVGSTADVSGPGYTNVIVIGQDAQGTASNQVTIGSALTNSYRAYQNWTNISDGRYKKNIKEDVPGLAFINKLRPITYTLDASGLDAFLNKGRSKQNEQSPEGKAVMDKAFKEKEAVVQTGFVAQDVEKVAHALNYDFSGVDAPKNANDVYGLRYSDFVVPLVKAVQELDSENTALKTQLANVYERLNKLETAQNGNNNLTFNSASLDQNTPNPVSGSTTIRYHLPENITSAVLNITNAKGQLVKTMPLTSSSNQINVNTVALASGTYNYTLYIDNRQIASKRMVITK